LVPEEAEILKKYEYLFVGGFAHSGKICTSQLP